MRPLRIAGPVLAVRGVPVRSGAREPRRIAPANRVDVDAMDAVRQAGCINAEGHSARGLPSTNGADRLAVGANERHRRAALRFGGGAGGGEERKEECDLTHILKTHQLSVGSTRTST